MPKYRVEKTYVNCMGSINSFVVSDSLVETKEENALWHLNTMRRHDGLTEWKHIPIKLTYTKLEE